MFSKNIIFENFQNVKKTKPEKKLKKKLETHYKSKLFKSFYKNYNYSFNKKKIKKYKKFRNFNLIGMGGSSLGSKAIYSFLNHKIKKKFVFVDNISPNKKINSSIKTLNIIISKSGETLETISNFESLKFKNQNLFVCENSNNSLRRIGRKLMGDIIDHKNFIGGRYSVLSEAGMLPAMFMGLDEKKFKVFDKLIKNKTFINELIKNVSFTFNLIKRKKLNSIILNYDENSDDLFKWYQQLIAESLGKKSIGLLPFISNLPRDNHSLMQMYLDGPKNCFFTFFDIIDNSKNNKLTKIKLSQKQATKNVFNKKKIPYRSFDVVNRSETSLGELFIFFMLETILLGEMLNINPFNQPSVELIKTETYKILKKL